MDHAGDLRRCSLLAVYGTLMVGERNHAHHLGVPAVAQGTIRGRLVEVPAPTARDYAYPALLVGSDRVVVDVVTLVSAQVLASIDDLEFDVDEHGEAEYERVITTVQTFEGTDLDAWVYRYRWPVPADWRSIPGGDWRRRRR